MSVETAKEQWNVKVPQRFEIRGKLGQGGMASVFHAFDKVGERDVALKFLPPSDDDNLKKRFQREAADLAGVFHPNVVDFYSLGESGGQEFIEMEYVSGGTLNGFLRRCDSLKSVLEVFAQICDGLQHIHESGLVHRDIKPANILMTEDQVPKISDLGLARQQEGRTQLTQDGTVLGTAAYLAPEQLRSHAVDHLADLYALGVALFEAVTSEKPFQAANPLAMLRAHFEEKPPVPSSLVPGLPQQLDALILRLMEKQSDKRPQSAQEVAQQLRAIAAELTPAQDKLVASTPSAKLARAKLQLSMGEWQSARRLLNDLDLQEHPDLTLELQVLKARSQVAAGRPEALEECREAVEACRQSEDLKLLGEALVCLGAAANRAEQWEQAESALQEARGIVPSSNHELQVRMLDSLAELYASGPHSNDPESQEKAQQFKKIAAGLTRRSDSLQSRSFVKGGSTSKAPSATGKSTRLMSTPSLQALPKRAPLALGACALVLALLAFAGYRWWNNRPSAVAIDSEPGGAAILIDDQRYYAPLTMELPKGEHKLKVFKQGYKPHEEVITLKPGGNFQLKATLQSASGQVNFTTTPQKAVVFIDDQKKGEAPLELSGLPPRTYKVKVTKKGYIDYEGKVEVTAGQTRNLAISLKKVPPPPPPQRTYYPRASYPRSSTRRYSQPRRRSGKGDGYYDTGLFKVKNPF